ncbi:hypothetical protein DICPUDRAFT_13745, partial [Dictyostelium purpureum]
YFDENEDDENEKWVTKNYKSSGKKSDAYLSCPCCFTLLCVECQRHSTYKNQYRAISVNNCIVDKEINNNNNNNNNNTNNDDSSSDEDEDEVYQPVKCSVCETHVAMFDKDEVYHFFNVFPS